MPILETHKRTLIKSITWRILGMVTTILIVYAFTGRLLLSLEVGGVEVVLKVIIYFLHERVWGRVSWGKKKHPLEDFPVKKELTPEHREIIRQRLKDLGYLE
ncbi:MAG TPA: DUF2061 domain-containing protein [bacterium (Candidatus Stahlbacteria)]|nr:DUF2061 domain-containing protein [Candidatus Stahlbacteria bacterium]